jgi:uncharacterized protein
LKHFQQALINYNLAIELDPRNYEYLISKIECLYILNKYNEAIIICNKAIQIEPNYSTAYVIKSECLLEMNEYYLAILNLNKSIELEPNSKHAYILKSKYKSLFSDSLESAFKIFQTNKLKSAKSSII